MIKKVQCKQVGYQKLYWGQLDFWVQHRNSGQEWQKVKGCAVRMTDRLKFSASFLRIAFMNLLDLEKSQTKKTSNMEYK